MSNKSPLNSVSDETVNDVLHEFDGTITEVSNETEAVVFSPLPYHTRLNPPKKTTFCSANPSKVQESPLDARSPQEVLAYHGMYKDDSIYTTNPSQVYEDLTMFNDLQDVLNRRIEAENKFASLPAEVRSRFNNSLAQFVSEVTDPSFDVHKVLTDQEASAYDSYLRKKAANERYEEYKQSDEYQQILKDAELRSQFAEESYKKWLESRGVK